MSVKFNCSNGLICNFSIVIFLFLIPSSLFSVSSVTLQTPTLSQCQDLLLGQYRCDSPIIDNFTQEPVGCQRNHSSNDDTAPILCYTAPNISCSNGIYNASTDTYLFEKRVKCRWTNGKYYRTTIALSLFLGIFGVDRIYLGYYVIGLLKLFTCGFMLIGVLIDLILIILQILPPADKSNYIIEYYGPRIIWNMVARHIENIKDLLFNEPLFNNNDGDEEVKISRSAKRKRIKKQKQQEIQSKKQEEEKQQPIETIVFNDPKKRRKNKKISSTSIQSTNRLDEQEDETQQDLDNKTGELDLEKARYDVYKFGITGLEKTKYKNARIALAVSLGAKPPKQKSINYREFLEKSKENKVKEKESIENARLLGDIFRKNLSSKQNINQHKNRKALINRGDVGHLPFSSVGTFKSGVLRLSKSDIALKFTVSGLLKTNIYRFLTTQLNISSLNDHTVSNILYNNDKTYDLLHNCLQVIDNYLTDDENQQFLNELEPYMKRKRYEYNENFFFSFWAIHGYRETEKSQWTVQNDQVIKRVKQLAFTEPTKTLIDVHVLDLAKDGYIKPHIDSIRYCGTTIAGLSFLSPSVMRLIHEKEPTLIAYILLKPKSLYIMKDNARFMFTHEILNDKESYFNNVHIPRNRRLSIICRNPPLNPNAG
ncbi:unnamed protein product [Didymodactylos carnosus]|uniref:TM2 domain-containing protein n=1 Tax=Didymodactylos carnosus TaxID=1234261 RepID=A0A813QGF1_9BILA|nr:unnamed protein product [Didymodactylos carnosus]CAF3548324.1 unnamed protein product [Didymodactylos carnosus]